jgi:hypothetical protein
MSTELVQTLVNAVLLIGVALIAGSIGLKRFEAIDRRFDALDGPFGAIDRRFDALDGRFGAIDRRFDALDGRFGAIDDRFGRIDDRFGTMEHSLIGSIDGLRNELKHDIALVDAHVGEVRAELTQTRSDLTYVALAVGARRAEGSN